MRKFKVGDKVQVIAGKDKGKQGNILKINWKNNTLLVEGINVATKAIKQSQENPNGGFAKSETFLNISNVSHLSPKTGKVSRVGFKSKDSKLIRVSKSCGSEI